MLLKISKIFLYAALFNVLVVMASTFFPFIGGKYYFFRLSVEFSLAFFIFWWAFEARADEAAKLFKDAVSKPLFMAVSAFVLSFVLASLFAYDSHAAFWSNYERGEGAFQMIHYYIFFSLLVMLFRSFVEWKRAFQMSLVAASLMIVYGIFAQGVILIPGVNMGISRENSFHLFNFIGPFVGGGAPEGTWDRLTSPRFQGSLGNPAYVAPYLMFAMFYALYLWFRPAGDHKKSEKKNGNNRNRAWLRVLGYGALTAFFLVFFILSQTRGTFLGLAAAIIVFFSYLLLRMPEKRKWIAIAVAGLVLVASLLIAYRNSPFVQKIPGARFLELVDLGFKDRTIQTRFWTWTSAWHGFQERPIFGWGPENFSTVFDKYFEPGHYIPGTNSETWFDRAHSVFFDYLAETGILGLASYVAIFVVFYMQFFKKGFFRRAQHSNSSVSVVQSALLFSLPVGYLIQGLALFDVLPIYMNLFLFLAFSSYLYYHEPAH